VVDQSELEKRGIPTVTVVTNQFLSLAKSTVKSTGLSEMAFVEVEHPLGMIPLDEVRAKAEKAFPEIINKAIKWQPAAVVTAAPRKPYPAERIKFRGTYTSLNQMFAERGWSLGLPIMSPTEEAVKAMLKGTKHDPAEVVWVVPPRQGN